MQSDGHADLIYRLVIIVFSLLETRYSTNIQGIKQMLSFD